MRKLILYIAASLDGMIAGPGGDVDWLEEFPNPEGTDHGYAEFIDSIDTSIQGNKTYKQVLGFDIEFPYKDLTNYVFTKEKGRPEDKYVKYLSGNVIEEVKRIKSEHGKNIWLIGGARANTLCWNAGLIDEIHLFIMPIILGRGIPLLSDFPDRKKLNLEATKTYSTGAVRLIYKVR